jgi:hypothetical protein
MVLGSLKNIELSVKEIKVKAEAVSDSAQTEKINMMADSLSNLVLTSNAHMTSKWNDGSSAKMIQEASRKLYEKVMVLVNSCNSVSTNAIFSDDDEMQQSSVVNAAV